ncbi:MAG: dihydropteroate synthase [Nesterenkonia sp.]|nr:dihydropteroate synthase [Nesterenkonia sp.]
MDTMGAMPGTGPNTGALRVVRKAPPAHFDRLPTDRTLVMGVLNITPDSFSDGGRFVEGGRVNHDLAVQAGLGLHRAGADIIDVGGESTRPGSTPTDPEDERRRILTAVQALFTAGALVSVDTRRPATAEAAVAAAPNPDAVIVNDVSGLVTDPAMPELVARTGVRVIVTHNRDVPETMQERAEYDDVVAEVLQELGQVRRRYLDAGVAEDRIIIDPGIGFAKTAEQSWTLLRNLHRFTADADRVLVGVSRKGFLGDLLADPSGRRPAEGRDAATVALTALAAQAGVWAVRVHGVEANLDAVRVVAEVHGGPASSDQRSGDA